MHRFGTLQAVCAVTAALLRDRTGTQDPAQARRPQARPATRQDDPGPVIH